MTDDSDSDLLGRFVAQRDQAAFTALVQRHAPLVLGVCWRVLDDHHDAEDAAQAAFLMLARRADQLVPPLGPWLYRVALNLARNALRDRRSRQRMQREAAAMPQADSPPEAFTAEIDSALATLPAGERTAITLFHLEGRPVEEVAQLIGRPVGTVCSWLARGRERLRHQLARRGVAVPVALLLTALGGLSAVEVPAGFAAATAGAAATFLASTGVATPAAALASQGIKTMAIINAIKTSLIAASLAATVGAAGWIAAAEGAGGKKPSGILGAPTFMPTLEHPVGWRGDGTGRYPGATPPTAWGRKRSGSGYETKGILWAKPLPNIGVSSPILVGDRIFVTGEVADLICLDKHTGRILWIRSNPAVEGATDEQRGAPEYAEKIAPLLPQLAKANADLVDALNAIQPTAAASAFRQVPAQAKKKELEKQILNTWLAINKKRDEYGLYGAQGVFGYAGPTPSSDGKHVYVFYATGISACYDLDGNRTWIASGRGGGAEHGNFSSPVLYGNQFVVWANELRSYDAATGKLLWKNPCQPRNTYGSNFLILTGGDAVVGSQNGTFARLSDGKAIWTTGGGAAFDDAIPTPVVENGMIYAHGGYKDEVGFKAYKVPTSANGGSVTPAFTVKSEWAGDEIAIDPKKNSFDRSYTASPLVVDGLVYRLTEGGGLIVNNAATGEVAYRKVLPMKAKTEYWNWGGASVSPTLAGKYIYLIDNQGMTVVIQAGPQYKEVAQNLIEESRDGKNQEQNLATPVFDGARMYHRTPEFLYCIGDK